MRSEPGGQHCARCAAVAGRSESRVPALVLGFVVVEFGEECVDAYAPLVELVFSSAGLDCWLVGVGWPRRAGWSVPGAGVAAFVDGFERADRDVCVQLGGGELGVPEHRLDVANVGAAFE